jgi:cytochrome c-type biogenesis protein
VTAAALTFLAGVVSVATPCVLPLVPAYLSAVSAVDVDRLGQRTTAWRVVRASIPFVAGFTVVFVALGAGAALVAGVLSGARREEVAGLVLVVVGLAFVGLLPLPQRLVAPELVGRARARGSGALLGAAFAACATPCIGPILATVLVVAGDTGTVLEGSALLALYSIGIGVAFVVVGVAFTHAMRPLRWVRDHYVHLRVAGGAVLVAVGLLLFFGRYWWLNVYFNRLLRSIGLGV